MKIKSVRRAIARILLGPGGEIGLGLGRWFGREEKKILGYRGGIRMKVGRQEQANREQSGLQPRAPGRGCKTARMEPGVTKL